MTGWQHPLYFTLSCIVCVLTLLVGARCRGQRETLLHYVLLFCSDPVLVLSYEEKESAIPSLMTSRLSLSSLFRCVSTSYLFHILIKKVITVLEEVV